MNTLLTSLGQVGYLAVGNGILIRVIQTVKVLYSYMVNLRLIKASIMC